MRVMLKDVAREADCSLMAVSRVMNGKQLNHVSPKLQKRIRDAAKKLDYQSNSVAQALRTGRTCSIGLVVGKISGHAQACQAHALLNEVKKYGYQLNIVLTNYNKKEEEKALEELINRQSDGIIYTLSLDPDSKIYQKLVKRKIPLLLGHDSAHLFNTVSIENDEVFTKAFELFRSRGHSRVAMISGEENFQHCHFSKIAEKCGVELVVFPHTPLHSSIRKSFELFLNEEIPAVISNANEVIQHLLRYLREIGSTFQPEYIYPYTLPFDYIESSPFCLGAIIVPFREVIETMTKRLVEIIENPDSSRCDIKLAGRFVTCEEVRKLYFDQINDPYYDIF